MRILITRYIHLFFLTLFIAACSGGGDDDTTLSPEEPLQEEPPAVGFELLQIVSANEIIVWVSSDITEEEFNAIELPDNWAKNQPRETDPDSARFLRSPDATEDGPLDEAEHFGHIWKQNAKIIATNVGVDGQSLLTGNSIAKYHEVTFNTDSTLHLLISPQGEQYVRISRDANRENDEPSVPDTWQTGDYTTPESLTFMLPNPTLNIRLDNQDSFQGPITPIPVDQIVNLAFGNVPADTQGEVPIALTTELCEDPSNLEPILDALGTGFGNPSYGQVNQAQIQKLLEEPTEGPFYMVNLIRFREQAVYADGRETDLTGREANELYSPSEFLQAIGAKIAFQAEVTENTADLTTEWEQVAIVEYPCPIAFMAMSVHPEFKQRSIHKDAGLEASIVMVTYAEELEALDIPETPYPGSEDDPSFEFVQVLQFFDEAQYSEASGEPQRTGAEAMAVYADSVANAQNSVGIYPRMRLNVDGVIIGDGSEWSSVWIDVVPSQTAFDMYNIDSDVLDAQFHRDAAVDNEYAMKTQPSLAISPAPFGRGARYCELLLVTQSDSGFEAEVWGTQGLNYCPQEALDSLDLEVISNEYGALQTSLNGPRIWVVDQTSNQVVDRQVRLFGTLLMSNLATVQVDPSSGGQPEIPPYEEQIVLRSTTYEFLQGQYVYELTSADGSKYVMQSVSLMENPDLTLDDLLQLEALISLPEGWTYAARVLEQPLILEVDGEATVITDDLGNTYQRVTPTDD